MHNIINRQALGLIIGLAIQYALGMAINLFVAFPTGKNPHEAWGFVLHNPLVLLHLLLGTLIVAGAIALLVRVIKAHNATWLRAAISGLLWVLVAWAAGDTFVTSQLGVLSYAMALGFLLAILSYGFGLYQSRNAAAQ